MKPKVAILLCTYNGQQYLAEQLDSFVTQTYSNWEVWASDDDSKDDTRLILERYQNAWPTGCMHVCYGPGRGFSGNFISLTCKPDIVADYYAYSDQDDIWEVEKLERAVHWLSTVPANIPALYCSRTRLVDSDNHEIGLSPLVAMSPSFANAITQNIGGGNTMVFNHAAREIIRRVGVNIAIVSHDWWAYMVVTGCGGRVYYDRIPSLRYRQHSNNLIGMSATWSARLERFQWLLKGRFRSWNEVNLFALSAVSDRLTVHNKKILKCFSQARQSSLIARIFYFKCSTVHRQNFLDNYGLIVAVILGKI